MADINKVFGKRLRQALVEREIQQKDFAEALGVSYKTMSGYIQGHTSPTLEKLAAIAEKLDISADYLLGLSNEIRYLSGKSDPVGEDILMIRRAYVSMPHRQRKAVLELIQSVTDKNKE
jgi:transcriptional regulator with XRE-family HTH domain